MREFKTERTLVETDRVYEWKLPEAMERLFGGPTAMPVGAVIGFRVCEADIANDEPERLQLVVTTIGRASPSPATCRPTLGPKGSPAWTSGPASLRATGSVAYE